MKKFGRIGIILVLALCVVISMVSCGEDGPKAGDNSNESKSIKVYFADPAKTDNELVSEEVNKISKEKIGVEVELFFFANWGEYDQKMPKLIATNEKMDIGFSSGDTFVSFARDGAYYDISKDLDAYPGLKNLFGDGILLKGVTIDGGIYGIPTLKEMAAQWSVMLDKSVLEKHNIDKNDIKTMADLEVVLAALKADGRLGFNLANKGQHITFGSLPHYDMIIGEFCVSSDDSIKPTAKKVVNFINTDEFEEYVYLLRDWYNKGYISKDILENGNTTFEQAVAQDKSKYGMRYLSYAPGQEIGLSTQMGFEMTPIHMTEPTITNSSTRGSVYCIFNKSDNKQSSLKFLELWNTDKEVNTLIKFGIEGKHYNFIEEDGVKKIEKTENAGNMYVNQNWKSGNVILSYLEKGEPADKYEEYEKWNTSARKSSVLGFTPDISSIETEVANCNAVVTTKVAALLTGAVDPADPEFGIEACRKDLKESGCDKVVTELQKQYLDWINK